MTLELELRDLAVAIAREAGELAKRRRAEGVQIAATKTTLADIVTAADREVEDLIRARLAATRPNDGFLGEESGEAQADSDIIWVVDPIDGTVNYAKGFGQYAVSIAAVTGGVQPDAWTVLAAVVYAPELDECFSAARGHGAFRDGTKLAVAGDSPAGALVATGFGYDPATHDRDLATLARVMPFARDLRRMGSAALDLANVAAGRLDVYYERRLHPWDAAAGMLLVTEAGGEVYVDLSEERSPLYVAASPAFFDQAVAATRD